jgi:hypothetical protein
VSRHQSTKHTTYYELIDAVRNATGCPLCDIEASRVKRYFESLLHESVNDPGVREALARSRGYCQRHAHYLRCHGNGLGIAILYQDQIRIFLRSLHNLQTVTSKVARKRTGARRMEACPACRMQNECRKRYGSTLIEWIHDQEMRSALDAGRGLCVPRFLTVLDMPMDSKARTFLIEMQQARMTSLLRELEEFHRKHDYRLSHEGYGSESDSWSRAIRMMVGEHDAF